MIAFSQKNYNHLECESSLTKFDIVAEVLTNSGGICLYEAFLLWFASVPVWGVIAGRQQHLVSLRALWFPSRAICWGNKRY